MRIAPPANSIPAYVPPVAPVPVVALSPEASKALIASGVFQHSPNEVVWITPGKAQIPLGGPVGSVGSAALPGGIQLQAWRASQAGNSLLPTALEFAKQIKPVVDHAGVDVVAEGMAILVAGPDLLHAITSSDWRTPENLCLYGSTATSAAKILNHYVPIPHVDAALKVISVAFQVGEQVFLVAGKKAEG
jgi:hypothetical protein